MNSILLPNLFGSSKLLSRQCSTKKANRIKLLNFEKKSLFGPVIKGEGKKKLKSNDNVLRSHQDSYSSEMFWVLGRKWNEVLGKGQSGKTTHLVKSSKPNIEFNRKVPATNHQDTISSEVNEPSEPFGKHNEKSDALNEDGPTIFKKEILFSEDELKSLTRHPLIADAPTTEIQQNISIRDIPSVGKILQCTMPERARAALMRWKLSKIFELGEQGFADLQRVSSPVHKLWESVSDVLDKFNASPVLVEKHLLHPTLKYKGICDCVSDVEDQLTLIEWKKSGRSKPTIGSTYDAPLQLCAYLGALHSLPEYRGRIKQGMVVVAYEDGKQADVYKLNEIMLRKYWRSWLARLHEYWIRTRDGTLLEPI